MPTQAQRIKKLMYERGHPDRSHTRLLSEATGVSLEGIRQWFLLDADNIGSHTLAKIARSQGCRLEWLIEGIGPMDMGDRFDNARSVDVDYRKLPVLNYVQAGDPKQVIDDYAKGSGMEEMTIDAETAQGLSMESFALVVMGNSMSPDFQEGDTVIVDPNVKPHPGDIVVAKLDRMEEATLKKYRSRGIDGAGIESFELVPLNPDFQPIMVTPQNPGHVIGVVVRHSKDMLRRRR